MLFIINYIMNKGIKRYFSINGKDEFLNNHRYCLEFFFARLFVWPFSLKTNRYIDYISVDVEM